MSCKFPKSHRLLKRTEFQMMQHSSRRIVGNYTIIEVRKNQLGVCRLGITTSKKFGKAHQRNRFKRYVREVYRECGPFHFTGLFTGFDIHIRPKKMALIAEKREIERDFENAMSRVRLLFDHLN